MDLSLSKISTYRTQLMGVAALLIVLCHANIYPVATSPIIRKLLSFGNAGVDIFLFLSGVGVFYSLKGGGRKNLLKWYIKRYHRIFVPYVLMQIPYWSYFIAIGKFNLADSLYEFSTLAFWVRHTGMWYIALLIPLYLLAPFMYDLFCNGKNIYAFLSIVTLLILCKIPVVSENSLLLNVVANIQFAFVRVVSFILGLSVAKYIQQGISVNSGLIIAVSLTLWILCRLLEISPYWCIVPIILICSIYIIDALPNSGVLYKFLTLMGILSLEMYLANGYIRYAFIDSPLYSLDTKLFYGHYFDYFIIFLLSIILSLGVNFLTKKINK